MSKTYFLGKLSDINLRMQEHPGDAKRRLASESLNINRLESGILREDHQKELNNIKERLMKGIQPHTSGTIPTHIKGMSNSAAAEIIAKLKLFESELEPIE